MRRVLLTAALASLLGCQGGRQPPLVPGEGITVDDDGTTRVVALDSERIPIVDTCAAGQVLVRTAEGWSCRTTSDQAHDARITALEQGITERVDRATAEQERLQQSLTRIERAQDDLLSMLDAARSELATRQAADRAAPLSYGVIGCVPAPSSAALAHVDPMEAKVVHAGSAVGRIDLYCPVAPPTAVIAWNQLTMLYLDPDGVGTGARVRTTLHAIDAMGQDEVVASVDSNTGADRGLSERTASFTHDFDFERRYYFVLVSIERNAASLAPDARGVRLWR